MSILLYCLFSIEIYVKLDVFAYVFVVIQMEPARRYEVSFDLQNISDTRRFDIEVGLGHVSHAMIEFVM